MIQRNTSKQAFWFLTLIILLLLPSLHTQIVPASLNIDSTVMDNLLKIIDARFFNSATVPTPAIPLRRMLRLAFHDCMGGCDGSVNLNQAHNRGLEIAVTQMTRFYNDTTQLRKYLTRADFWALVMTRTLAVCIKNAGSTVPYHTSTPHFSYGRIDATRFDDDINQGSIPDGRDNWSKVLTSIQAGIPGVSEADFVALMGLHGAGRNNFNNSGFNGTWTSPNDLQKVSNLYYQVLIGKNRPSGHSYSQVNSAFTPGTFEQPVINKKYNPPRPEQPKIQWQTTRNQRSMMLNVDMAMYLNMTFDASGRTSQRYFAQGNRTALLKSNGTGFATTANNAQLVFNFAQNNNLYLSSLVPAFIRLVNVKPSIGGTFKTYNPQKVCVNKKWTCRGDVLYSNCGITTTAC